MKWSRGVKSPCASPVAPPRGERGLKWRMLADGRLTGTGVAPPRGERGLKLYTNLNSSQAQFVAPPRGERGLKFACDALCIPAPRGRSPSWGAWIEMVNVSALSNHLPVAPPRGERGLKYQTAPPRIGHEYVAPPRGERGLKFLFAAALN